MVASVGIFEAFPEPVFFFHCLHGGVELLGGFEVAVIGRAHVEDHHVIEPVQKNNGQNEQTTVMVR